MAKKISSPAKALYIIFALALVFSAIPALAVSLATPVGANNGPTATAYGSDFILNEGGSTGFARWVWDDIVTLFDQGTPDPAGDVNSGTHSAWLHAMGGSDYAWVAVLWGCTIGELTDTELSYYYRTVEGEPGPVMALAIDLDHNGSPDELAWVDTCPSPSADWTKWSVNFTTTLWDTFGHGTEMDWDTLVTQVGSDAKVVKVLVGYDQYNLPNGTCSGTGFVDDITVDTRTWDLEPIETDCVKSDFEQGNAGYPIQIEIGNTTANVEGSEVLEESTTAPDGNTSTFDVAHAPKSVGTTSAYDLGGQLTVTDVAQVDGAGTVTVSETPPATYPVFPGTGCADAEANMNDTAINLTTPTQLTVTTVVDSGNCTEIAPGTGHYLYVFLTGLDGLGTPINEMLYFMGDDSQETTTQAFATINQYGIDATYSITDGASAAKGLFIEAENHVWVTYDWHQADTVTVYAQLEGNGGTVAVELIEVNSSTLAPDKDSGYFKGILYPVTSGNDDPDPATPTGLERHELNAPHCSTIELKYPTDDPSDIFKTFKVDNLPPVMSNEDPEPSTNESLPEISVDIVDDKCQVREDSLRFFFDGTEYLVFDWDGTTLTWTPASTLTDGIYRVDLKFADCCWNWGQDWWEFEVESSPPMMIDAITGWGWYWVDSRPENFHSRTTIMVIFSEPLNPMTVEPSDFTVNYATPIDVEYHDYDGSWPGDCDGSHDYGLVFLTLATPLATDATPTVVQVGVVEDLAGNPCDKYYEWVCPLDPATLNYLNDPPPQTVTAQDGIGPAITVVASPEEPGYNETVTVTATSSEPLSEAYLFVAEGLPWDYNWDHVKPIGWDLQGPEIPCSPTGHVPSTTWDGYGHEDRYWRVMTADPQDPTGKTWTASFTNEMQPREEWFVEVAAHDFTEWWVDMDDPEDLGVWYDYECNDHDKYWKHEKWTQESLIMWGHWVKFLYLCEGWNLISVPWDLTNPSPQQFFNFKTNVGVTKVYHYTGGQYGYWQYSLLSPISGYWTGTITSIEPGKSYWVWVSPPELRLVLSMVQPDPMSPPLALDLKKGWNMHGYVEMADTAGHGTESGDDSVSRMSNDLDMRFYFESIEDHVSIMYAYDPCEIWYEKSGPGDPNWIRFDAGDLGLRNSQLHDENWHKKEMRIGCGYWLFVDEDVLFAP